MSEPTTKPANPMLALMTPEFLQDPYRFYRTLSEGGSVRHLPGLFGIGGWVVTSHAVCSSVLRSKQFGKEGHKVLPPETLALIPQEDPALAERRLNSMLFRDPPGHTRLRGLVNQAFTPRTVERLRPHVAEIADRLIDAVIDRGTMDLIADFAFPLPIIVIAELLGVPPEDRDRFKAWSSELTLGLSPAAGPAELERVKKALDAFDAYMGAVIEERRVSPRADLISELTKAQEAGDKLNMEELLATCRLLLTAGHETTVNLIGNGLLALLRNPDQRALIEADWSLLPGAIEELLRYDSPVQMTSRFTLEDGPLGTESVKRGEVVLLLLGGANRDPTVFADPDRLDIRRDNAHAHIGFGAGIHYCIGAPLARLEGAIAVSALFKRLPKLAIASDELIFRPHVVLRGLSSFPVTF